MKKLFIISFTFLCTILSILSSFNFLFDFSESIENDKANIVIEKPEDLSNAEFLDSINSVLETYDMDIMVRYVENNNGKENYIYYKTNHSDDFVDINTTSDFAGLLANNCVSTYSYNEYYTYALEAPSNLQDITFFAWENAESLNLENNSYYVLESQKDLAITVIGQLDYNVTLRERYLISGKLPTLFYSAISFALLIASMIFYTFADGRTIIIKKMDGYKSRSILWDEIVQLMIPAGKSFAIISLIVCLFGLFMYNNVFIPYLEFLLPNVVLIILFLLIGYFLSLLIIALLNNPHYIKGRVHNKGIYVITILVKTFALALTVFFLSISLWNTINTYHMAINSYNYANNYVESGNDFVTLYVSDNNGVLDDEAEANYLDFYKETVDLFHGVLIDSGNYTYVFGTDLTMADMYDQDSIVINSNYLDLNPLMDESGNIITSDILSKEKFNVLVPASKTDKIEEYQESIRNGYSAEPSFIIYDDLNSEIYSYNPEVTSKYGVIDSPFILIIDENYLTGGFVEAYCSSGYYFLTVSDDELETLDSIIEETGIAKFTPNTPTLSERFKDNIKSNLSGLAVYTLQSLSSVGLLVYLIIFGTQIYFTNNRKTITYKLIAGYSRLSTIKRHLLLILVTHGIAYVSASLLANMSDICIIKPLVVFTALLELVLIYATSVKLSKSSINKVIKGEE